MPIAATEIFRRVTTEVQDDSSIRWTLRELVDAFNDGERDILTHRPDALDVRFKLELAPGATQALPDEYALLIDVPANDTVGSKRAIRVANREILDAQLPGWRGMTPSAVIRHYVFDPRESRVFEVYPPAASGAAVTVVASKRPTPITMPADGVTWEDATGAMSLPDEFANALRDYIVYRLYLKDAKYTANDQRAMQRYAAYANTLGIDLKSIVMFSPATTRDSNPNAPRAPQQPQQ